jgi:hypothetical protein
MILQPFQVGNSTTGGQVYNCCLHQTLYNGAYLPTLMVCFVIWIVSTSAIANTKAWAKQLELANTHDTFLNVCQSIKLNAFGFEAVYA